MQCIGADRESCIQSRPAVLKTFALQLQGLIVPLWKGLTYTNRQAKAQGSSNCFIVVCKKHHLLQKKKSTADKVYAGLVLIFKAQ